eukprot:scaffold55693_cov60-Phaeocystis_antarctica.AAC.5
MANSMAIPVPAMAGGFLWPHLLWLRVTGGLAGRCLRRYARATNAVAPCVLGRRGHTTRDAEARRAALRTPLELRRPYPFEPAQGGSHARGL